MAANGWDGKDRREPVPERWHLKKEFQVGQLVTIVTVAVGAFSYIMSLEKRISLLEASLISMSSRMSEREQSYIRERAEFRGEVLTKFQTIDTKLDALLSRRPTDRP